MLLFPIYFSCECGKIYKLKIKKKEREKNRLKIQKNKDKIIENNFNNFNRKMIRNK